MKRFFAGLKRFFRILKEDNIVSYASSCAFFIFLSIIPMIMLLLTIIPFTPAKPEMITEWVLTYFPAGTGKLIASILSEVSEKSWGILSIAAITTFWAAGKGVNSLIAGFNAIDHTIDKRNGISLRIISSLYTLVFLASIVVLLTLVVGGRFILNNLISHFQNAVEVLSFLVYFRSVISIVLMALLFMICFSLLPYKHHKFKETFPGAILASLAWTGFTFLFSFFVTRFNGFSMYGSLTAIIILLFWLYFCMYILFICANLNRYITPLLIALKRSKFKLSEVRGQMESLEED